MVEVGLGLVGVELADVVLLDEGAQGLGGGLGALAEELGWDGDGIGVGGAEEGLEDGSLAWA